MVDEAKKKMLNQWNWGCEYLCTKSNLENNGDPPLECQFIILEYVKLLRSQYLLMNMLNIKTIVFYSWLYKIVQSTLYSLF